MTTTSTCSSVILRGAPGRGASARPADPAFDEPDPPLADRLPRHAVRAATAVSGAVPPSSAQASTIRARNASDWDAVRLRDSDSRASRSPSVSSSGTSFGLGTKYCTALRQCADSCRDRKARTLTVGWTIEHSRAFRRLVK